MCVAIQILCCRQLARKAVSRYKNCIVTEEVGLAGIRLQYKILYCDSGLVTLGAAGERGAWQAGGTGARGAWQAGRGVRAERYDTAGGPGHDTARSPTTRPRVHGL